MGIQFFVVTDRESEDSSKSSNGGDYSFGRTIAVRNGEPFAVRFWTSADFDYCPKCGTFESEECDSSPRPSDLEGWENGEEIPAGTPRLDIALRQLESGRFAMSS